MGWVQYEGGMDAAYSLGRWLLLVGILLLVGCKGAGAPGLAMTGRGQAPDYPDPLPPVAPLSPVDPANQLPEPSVQGLPVAPGGSVQGFPVRPDDASGGQAVVTTSYSNVASKIARAPDLLKESIPQIKVVALVGTTNLITDQEIKEAVHQRLADYAGLPTKSQRDAKEKELYKGEMRRIIERELILDDMYIRLKKNNKSASIEEIKTYAAESAERYLRGLRKAHGIKTEEEFLSYLRAQGLSTPVIRRQIERQMMADEYVRSVMKDKVRAVSFADIRAYYEAHPEEFQIEDKVRWQDIFISFNNHPSPQAAYQYAEQVRDQANRPGADFEALVKAQEKGVALQRQSWDGIGTRRGELPLDVAPTVWALEPGAVSGLVETPAGYHIVKVLERQYAGVRPLDHEIQNEIRMKLKKEFHEIEYKKMVEELWRNATVQIIEMPS
jgi:parvulin-like peptidyl-prolyl isomerase